MAENPPDIENVAREIYACVGESRALIFQIGQIATIMDKSGLPEEERGWISQVIPNYVFRAGDKLEMIERVVRTAVATRGKAALIVGSTNVGRVIGASLARMEPELSYKRKHVTIDVIGVPVVQTDPEIARSILKHPIANVLKYTGTPPEGFGGEIQIVIIEEEKEVVASITDDGIGIAREDLERIFEEGYVVKDIPIAEEVPRNGQGLFIARAWAKLLGASITANSEGVGKGSTFIVRIPKRFSVKAERITPTAVIRDFLHDVANKITFIYGYVLTILQSGRELSPEQIEALKAIVERCDQITKNLNRIMDYAKSLSTGSNIGDEA